MAHGWKKNSKKLQLDYFDVLMKQLSKSYDDRNYQNMISYLKEICDITAQTFSFNTYRYVWSQLSLLFSFQAYRYGSLPGKDITFLDSDSFKDIYSAFDALQDLFTDVFDSFPHLEIKSNNPHINNALKYIVNNIDSDTSLAKVAKEIHLSASYLSYLFQKEFGRTYVDLTNELRIKFAAKLLSKSAKVYEAAQQVGFDNSKYFSKLFKKYVGVTPQEYKKQSSSGTLGRE